MYSSHLALILTSGILAELGSGDVSYNFSAFAVQEGIEKEDWSRYDESTLNSTTLSNYTSKEIMGMLKYIAQRKFIAVLFIIVEYWKQFK